MPSSTAISRTTIINYKFRISNEHAEKRKGCNTALEPSGSEETERSRNLKRAQHHREHDKLQSRLAQGILERLPPEHRSFLWAPRKWWSFSISYLTIMLKIEEEWKIEKRVLMRQKVLISKTESRGYSSQPEKKVWYMRAKLLPVVLLGSPLLARLDGHAEYHCMALNMLDRLNPHMHLGREDLQNGDLRFVDSAQWT